MSLFSWIVFGLLAGFIASKLVEKHGLGPLLDLVLGVIGALVGGGMFSLVGARGITGFDPWSLFVAVVGATTVLLVYHAIRRRMKPRTPRAA